MKRELPLLLTSLIGLLMILAFFIPHPWVSVPADFVYQSALIVMAFAYILGGINVLIVNGDAIFKRRRDWPFKIVLVVALIVTVATGLLEGRDWNDASSRSIWIYNNLYSPMSATMFSLLAFFIASAAFRAFRIRTFEAGLLAVAALIVMLGRVPIGELLLPAIPLSWFGWLPADIAQSLHDGLRLGSAQDWIMNFPQNAAKRAILIGAAMGVMATGLRIILGIERAYLGSGD